MNKPLKDKRKYTTYMYILLLLFLQRPRLFSVLVLLGDLALLSILLRQRIPEVFVARTKRKSDDGVDWVTPAAPGKSSKQDAGSASGVINRVFHRTHALSFVADVVTTFLRCLFVAVSVHSGSSSVMASSSSSSTLVSLADSCLRLEGPGLLAFVAAAATAAEPSSLSSSSVEEMMMGDVSSRDCV